MKARSLKDIYVEMKLKLTKQKTQREMKVQ